MRWSNFDAGRARPRTRCRCYARRLQPAEGTADHAQIAALARALDRAVPAAALDVLAQYAGLVRTWGRKVNLVSAREPAQFIEVLFADALVLCSATLVPQASRVVDVGAGAGAPTLPLLLLRTDLRATCVEPRQKRAAFLRHAAQRLALGARVEVVERRVDPDLPILDGAPFDVALSRATLAPATWLRMGAALAPRVVVMTAREPAPMPVAGLRVVAEADYALPSARAPRRITVYDSESRGSESPGSTSPGPTSRTSRGPRA